MLRWAFTASGFLTAVTLSTPSFEACLDLSHRPSALELAEDAIHHVAHDDS